MTLLAEVTLDNVQVAPEQSPLKPVKLYPALAVAVQVLLPPSITTEGEHDVVPPATGFAVPVIA
jgi:hypothetical protein